MDEEELEQPRKKITLSNFFESIVSVEKVANRAFEKTNTNLDAINENKALIQALTQSLDDVLVEIREIKEYITIEKDEEKDRLFSEEDQEQKERRFKRVRGTFNTDDTEEDVSDDETETETKSGGVGENIISRALQNPNIIQMIAGFAAFYVARGLNTFLNPISSQLDSIDPIFKKDVTEKGTEEQNIQKFYDGGRVLDTDNNISNNNEDSEIAMVTPGEFVVTKDAVEKVGVETLEGINAAASGVNENPFEVEDTNTPDFSLLTAVSALEGGDPQARVDVAQSIYNRVNEVKKDIADGPGTTAITDYTQSSFKNTGSGFPEPTISDILLRDGQYQPTYIDPNVDEGPDTAVSDEFMNVKDRESAIAAMKSYYDKREDDRSMEDIESLYDQTVLDLQDQKMNKEAAAFVGGRTEFRSGEFFEEGDQYRGELGVDNTFFSDLGTGTQLETGAAVSPLIQGYNKGGSVKDSEPALLTPGEFVMSKDAVKKIGVDTLKGLNSSVGATNKPTDYVLKGYNDGGYSTKSYSTKSSGVMRRGEVVSGDASLRDFKIYHAEENLDNQREIHGFDSPEANEAQKDLLILRGVPEEAIYVDKKGRLQIKGYSQGLDGKTTVEGKDKRGILGMIGGSIDAITGNLTDFDKRGGKTFGATRVATGMLDFATANMFDLDKRGGILDEIRGKNKNKKKKEEKQGGIDLKNIALGMIPGFGALAGGIKIANNLKDKKQNEGLIEGKIDVSDGLSDLELKTMQHRGLLPNLGVKKIESLRKLDDPISMSQSRPFNFTKTTTKPTVKEDKRGLFGVLGGVADRLTGNITDFDRRGGGIFGGGLIDAITGNITDFDRKGGKPTGLMRGMTGLVDAATLGLTDLDRRGGKPTGLARGLTGSIDYMTGNVLDLDRRGGKMMGAPRLAAGLIDHMTGNITDLDRMGGKQFGLPRIGMGILDAVTRDKFDFDQMGVDKKDKLKKNNIKFDTYDEFSDPDFDDLEASANKIQMTTTVNPDGSITTKGSGRLIAGEPYTPGQPLTEKQKLMITFGLRMGNTYSPELMESYNMEAIKSEKSIEPVVESKTDKLSQSIFTPPTSTQGSNIALLPVPMGNNQPQPINANDSVVAPAQPSNVDTTTVASTMSSVSFINMISNKQLSIG